MNSPSPLCTLSVVSHSQALLIRQLLVDLSQLEEQTFEVIITINQ